MAVCFTAANDTRATVQMDCCARDRGIDAPIHLKLLLTSYQRSDALREVIRQTPAVKTLQRLRQGYGAQVFVCFTKYTVGVAMERGRGGKGEAVAQRAGAAASGWRRARERRSGVDKRPSAHARSGGFSPAPKRKRAVEGPAGELVTGMTTSPRLHVASKTSRGTEQNPYQPFREATPGW